MSENKECVIISANDNEMGGAGKESKFAKMVDKTRLYSQVFYEIAGVCNAKCEFCITGKSNHPKGGFVDVEKFDRSLSILTEHGLADSQTRFHLYNWGEPTLHPKLDQIIQIVQDKHSFSYGLSTNAGRSIEYRPDWFKKLGYLAISMCGFSQESYNKIHQFDFEKVKSNIISIVSAAQACGYDTRRISISHHIYQFNIHEIPRLYEWAKNLNITYNPYFAVINDPVRRRQYVNNTLSVNEMKSISESLINHYPNLQIHNHSRNDCSQFDLLTIDEECNVVICCTIEREHPDSIIANILDQNFHEQLARWQPHAFCRNCIASGLSMPLVRQAEQIANNTLPNNPINLILDLLDAQNTHPANIPQSKHGFIKQVLKTGKKIEINIRKICDKIKKYVIKT